MSDQNGGTTNDAWQIYAASASPEIVRDGQSVTWTAMVASGFKAEGEEITVNVAPDRLLSPDEYEISYENDDFRITIHDVASFEFPIVSFEASASGGLVYGFVVVPTAVTPESLRTFHFALDTVVKSGCTPVTKPQGTIQAGEVVWVGTVSPPTAGCTVKITPRGATSTPESVIRVGSNGVYTTKTDIQGHGVVFLRATGPRGDSKEGRVDVP